MRIFNDNNYIPHASQNVCMYLVKDRDGKARHTLRSNSFHARVNLALFARKV